MSDQNDDGSNSEPFHLTTVPTRSTLFTPVSISYKPSSVPFAWNNPPLPCLTEKNTDVTKYWLRLYRDVLQGRRRRVSGIRRPSRGIMLALKGSWPMLALCHHSRQIAAPELCGWRTEVRRVPPMPTSRVTFAATMHSIAVRIDSKYLQFTKLACI